MNRLVCGVAVLLLVACSSRNDSRSAAPDKFFELEMPTWFEDASQRFVVSPDAKWAIYRSNNRPALIDLTDMP